MFTGPNIVTEGLVLALDAGNEKSYPGSGTTWYDLSGQGNNAVLSGGPVFSNGIVTFDGTNDYATISTNGLGSLDFREQQTISIWMKHSFTAGRRNPWDQAYGGYGTWTHEAGTSINGYYGDNGGNAQPYTSTNTGTTSRNVWNFVSRARNTSSVYWWVNKSLRSVASNPYGTLPTTTANIRIGNGYAGYWIGNMGIILAYNRSLSTEEIQQNYNATKSRFGLT